MKVENLTPFLSHKKRPASAVVDTIVMHATAGSGIEGSISTLRNKGFGYHYLIPKKGDKVFKGVPFMSMCSHAGNSYGPHEKDRGVSTVQGKGGMFVAKCSVNSYTIGICFQNMNGLEVVGGKLVNSGKVDPYTDFQEEAAREIIRQLKDALPHLKFITSHAIVSPGRKSDPLGYDLKQLAKDLGLQVWKP